MNTFLLVWNPKKWSWDNFYALKTKFDNGESVSLDWSCGNTKKIEVGDKVYFIRLGKSPKGIFASGKVEKERHLGKSWNSNETRQIYYVTVKLEKLLDPESDSIIARDALDNSEFQPMHWSSQSSGIQIPDEVAEQLGKTW